MLGVEACETVGAEPAGGGMRSLGPQPILLRRDTGFSRAAAGSATFRDALRPALKRGLDIGGGSSEQKGRPHCAAMPGAEAPWR